MDGHVSRNRTLAQRAGDAAEALVARHLVEAGWTILARNVRLGRREVDLVAVDPGPPATLVLLEVRWRAGRGWGLPEETFDARKRAHLRAALGQLLAVGALPDGRPLPCAQARVDFVAVEPPDRIRHHRYAT